MVAEKIGVGSRNFPQFLFLDIQKAPNYLCIINQTQKTMLWIVHPD